MRIAPVVGLGVGLAAGQAFAESAPITHVQHFTSVTSEAYSTSPSPEDTTAAVRFDLGNGSSIYYIDLWFGPSGPQRDVTLTIWDDTAETLEPGTMLSQQSLSVTPGGSIQQYSIFVSSLTPKIRVGITSPDGGPPGVGLDLDGISAPDRNFIKAADGAWQTADAASLPGDWVIAINHNGSDVDPNPIPPDAPDDGGDGDDTPATDDGGLDNETGCCSSSTGAGGGALLGLLVFGWMLAPRRR